MTQHVEQNTFHGINRICSENEQTFVLILSKVSKGINSVQVNDLSWEKENGL